jgi:hypothetical protein
MKNLFHRLKLTPFLNALKDEKIVEKHSEVISRATYGFFTFKLKGVDTIYTLLLFDDIGEMVLLEDSELKEENVKNFEQLINKLKH